MWLSPQFFPSIFSAAINPFWRITFSAQNDGFKSRDYLLNENMRLKLELDAMKMRISSSTTELLEKQNQELFSLLGRATTTSGVMVAAAVLSRPTAMPYDELIIDIGSIDNIGTSTLIYAPGRVLIGRVAEAFTYTSKVILFTSPKEDIAVEIGPNKIRATASGRGGGQYEAPVPHGSNISVGDIVSGTNIRDRALGNVIGMKSDPSDPFDTVLFAPPVNIYELRFVEAEIPKKAATLKRI